MKNLMKKLASLIAAILTSLALPAPGFAEEPGPYPVFYDGKAQFEAAIAAEEKLPPYEEHLTGLIVPHHLLVAPLIARGFRLASARTYKRAILLMPDHFRKANSPFATSGKNYETVLGPVGTDRPAVATLLAADGLVERNDLFDKDHAIRALLPFLKHYMPETRIVPVAVATKSTREDADRLAEVLLPLVDEDTIIIQSTDFSHFLPFAEAKQHDQQTLNVLASGDLDQISRLRLPDHVDSVIALYLNAVLQARLGAEIHVVASRNSNEYAQAYLKETTSYVTAVYGKFIKPTGHPIPGDVETLYLAGDFTLARNVMRLARHPASASAVKKAILEITKGRKLVVNLEGAILPNVPKTLRETSLAMPEELAMEWFGDLNVEAVSLANNHTEDFGELGLVLTQDVLDRAGIRGLPDLGLSEFDRFALFAATDLKSTGSRQKELLTPASFDMLYDYQGAKPVIAFLHWGEEYDPSPGARAFLLADELRRRGVSLIVGAHPHVRSNGLVSLAGGETLMIYSLGNFLFDQSSKISSGAMAEIRVFPQGTCFVRVIEVPNYYETGVTAARN